MFCLQHHLTNSDRQLTVTNLNYSPTYKNKSGLLIKSSRLEISELRNYFTKI